MTALLLENVAVLPAQVQSLRMLLTRLSRALDALVSARAARAFPKWRMRQVRRKINRYQGLNRAGERRQGKQAENAPSSNDAFSLGLSESAICNFSR